MPKLKSVNSIQVTLPSSTEDDPAIVTLDLRITAKQALDLTSSDNENRAAVDLLTSTITSWNFTNQSGGVEPITSETVEALPLGDFAFLAEMVTKSVEAAINEKSVGSAEEKV